MSETTLVLNNYYLVKVFTKGDMGSKIPHILSTWFEHSPFDEPSKTKQKIQVRDIKTFWHFVRIELVRGCGKKQILHIFYESIYHL